MNYLESYIIPFKNLKDGIHNYDFIIDNKFFEQFEKSEIQKGNLKAFVRLDRQITFIVLEIEIKGTINVLCDRCLEPYILPFKNADKIILKFGEEISDSGYIGEEIQIFNFNDTEINISQFLFEIIQIGLPLKKVHPDDSDNNPGCNPEILIELEQYICNEEEDITTDPRWDKLKNIKYKN